MENLQPKLRFAEFKEDKKDYYSVIGKCIDSNIYGPRFNSNDYNIEGNVKTIRGTDIQKNGTINYSNVPIALLDENVVSTHKLKYGDLVMITTAECGLTGVFQGDDMDYICSAYAVKIRLKENNNPLFFKQYFLTEYANNQINRFIRKATVSNLPASDIKKIKLFIPTLQEQTKIADFLGAVDKQLDILNQKKEKLNTYKKGVMQQLFSQQIRFKDDNGNNFPDWEEKTLGEVINFRNGKGHEKVIDSNGDFIVVNSKYISTDGLVSKYTSELISPLFKNDIVMVMSDLPNGKALGKCLLIDRDNYYTLNQRICALTPNQLHNNPIFLKYIINRNSYFLKFDDGVNQTNLKKNEVLNCPLSIPSIAEQTKIANFLSAIDTQIQAVENQITKTETYKKGLLQQMFV
ncbi:type I restriction enzyme, S subunit [Paenimyroides aquimaris]|uniref:Type I restriction enzyme, S subunit n=1 Tax=Paenimyroides marinum TaxID=1159016 RepID=A0A1H6LHJ0_9FLAO|nr:restriction endonuclease subunit S [Paenimyroides aquimaris]SEH84039.1 type I restriction enzyme, S subunit [Paenimyroides aquimaris]